MKRSTVNAVSSAVIGIAIAVPLIIFKANSQPTVDIVSVPELVTETQTELVMPYSTSHETQAVEEFTTEYTYYSFIPLSGDMQEWIHKIADEQQLSYDLVLAVIKTESEFQTDIIGDNGQAIGLCQIWPMWYQETATEHGLDIYNPIDNVKLMCIILNSHLEYCNGDLTQALQMYNSGQPDGTYYADRVYSNMAWLESQKGEQWEQ